MSPVKLCIANKHILVIDPSASHLAYSLCEVVDNKFIFNSIGMLWTLDKWKNGQKLFYMYYAFRLLLKKALNLDSVYSESYFVNFKQRMGVSMIPTVNNLLQMVIFEVKKDIEYAEISASTWRKVLNITPFKFDDGSKDYKVPTKLRVCEILSTDLPEMLISNVTGKERALPHDVTDCMAIALSIGKELKCGEFILSKDAFNNSMLLDELRKVKEDA